ncbi:MAG TPA: ROK family transcriptional regulator [Streptosporangiaceae bacterium]|nr:ROK family transcriptional regulator [Streptosporangiaceae bacterium]
MTARLAYVKGVRMASGGGTPPLVRQVNCALVLGILRGAGPLRLADLVKRSGLSRPTVGQVVEQLHDAGLIAYAEEEPSRPARSGRPPRLVRFRNEAAYVAGIDIGRRTVHVILTDLAGTVVARHRQPTSSARSAHDLLVTVRAAIRAALAVAGVPRDKVASVAAGTPGIVDAARGTVTLAYGMPGWSINLAHELRRSLHCPVKVENDVNLAALAELWYGTARSADTLVFVLWGERIGAGIVIGGELHRGASNAAGEIGFLALDPGTTAQPDSDGLGPFERLVGADAIARATPGHTSAEAVLSAAARGDTHAAAVVASTAARFAHGLAPILAVLDPDLVVIGGGVSQAGQALLDAIRENVRPLVLVPPHLALSSLGDEAVALGAARLALADAEHRILPAASLPGARPDGATLFAAGNGPGHAYERSVTTVS